MVTQNEARAKAQQKFNEYLTSEKSNILSKPIDRIKNEVFGAAYADGIRGGNSQTWVHDEVEQLYNRVQAIGNRMGNVLDDANIGNAVSQSGSLFDNAYKAEPNARVEDYQNAVREGVRVGSTGNNPVMDSLYSRAEDAFAQAGIRLSDVEKEQLVKPMIRDRMYDDHSAGVNARLADDVVDRLDNYVAALHTGRKNTEKKIFARVAVGMADFQKKQRENAALYEIIKTEFSNRIVRGDKAILDLAYLRTAALADLFDVEQYDFMDKSEHVVGELDCDGKHLLSEIGGKMGRARSDLRRAHRKTERDQEKLHRLLKDAAREARRQVRKYAGNDNTLDDGVVESREDADKLKGKKAPNAIDENNIAWAYEQLVSKAWLSLTADITEVVGALIEYRDLKAHARDLFKAIKDNGDNPVKGAATKVDTRGSNKRIVELLNEEVAYLDAALNEVEPAAAFYEGMDKAVTVDVFPQLVLNEDDVKAEIDGPGSLDQEGLVEVEVYTRDPAHAKRVCTLKGQRKDLKKHLDANNGMRFKLNRDTANMVTNADKRLLKALEFDPVTGGLVVGLARWAQFNKDLADRL